MAAQGVSKFPQEVTREMVANFARGGAAINVLTRHFGARLTVVDVGVAGGELEIVIDNEETVRFASRKIAPGTRDISKGPAMSRAQAIQALEAGIQVFMEEMAKGLDAVGTGDMGIANTTPSAAIAAAMLGVAPNRVVNRGTGIGDDALENKIRVVDRALEVNRPDPDDPIDVLSKIGGYEIGGIAGVILGACAHRVPVVVDGFISTAAALLASSFHPEVKHYLFSGHQSAVEGHRLMLNALGMEPMVDLGMRLGRGPGQLLGYPYWLQHRGWRRRCSPLMKPRCQGRETIRFKAKVSRPQCQIHAPARRVLGLDQSQIFEREPLLDHIGCPLQMTISAGRDLLARPDRRNARLVASPQRPGRMIDRHSGRWSRCRWRYPIPCGQAVDPIPEWWSLTSFALLPWLVPRPLYRPGEPSGCSLGRRGARRRIPHPPHNP